MGRPRLAPVVLIDQTRAEPATDSDDRPFDHPVSVGYRDAALATGLGERTLRSLVNAGRLPARRFGSRVVIRWSDLEAFVNGLPPYDPNGATA